MCEHISKIKRGTYNIIVVLLPVSVPDILSSKHTLRNTLLPTNYNRTNKNIYL